MEVVSRQRPLARLSDAHFLRLTAAVGRSAMAGTGAAGGGHPMTFTFRPASRDNVGLLLGLAGSSGSGKTYTALRLAKGMAGGPAVAAGGTQGGRAGDS